MDSKTLTFIEKAKEVHGDKYNYSKTVFKNRDSSLIITCKDHGDFKITAGGHLRGGNCPECVKISRHKKTMTTVEAIKRFRLKHGDKYDYSKFEYTGPKDKIIVICKDHGPFETTYVNHKNSGNCPKCKNKNRLSQKEVLERFKNTHGNRYDYSKMVYNNSTEPVEIICKEHGSFFVNARLHWDGCGHCPDCSKPKINDTESMINEFIKIHGDQYDYSKSIYSGWNIPVEIICKEHGSFFQKPGYHKNGSGCQKCNPKRTVTEKEVLERFKNTHGNRYDYSKMVYNNSTEPVEIICKEHGSFFQKPNSHYNGAGCPDCAKREKIISNNEILQRLELIKDKRDSFEYVNYNHNTNPITIVCKEHGAYKKHVVNYLNGFRCPKCSPKSKAEIEIHELIPGSVLNNRKIIEPLEIDIFSKKYNFGIEYNGIMFHTYGISNTQMFNNLDSLDKNKHLSKTTKMEEKGYQLFHINELDWLHPTKKEIWKSILNSKMGLTHRIFARKLKIIDLSSNNKFVNDFMNTNHLQGSRSFTYAYGLCNDKNEVYSIMTFGKPANGKAQWEIYRFVTVLNYTIVGGASKLLKYFERIHKPESLLSYAKRDWSQGGVYEKLGFKFSHNTEPSIHWFDPKSGVLYSRLKFQKHKLKDIDDFIFDESITAEQNIFQNGYRKYFDAGNKKYIKEYNE